MSDLKDIKGMENTLKLLDKYAQNTPDEDVNKALNEMGIDIDSITNTLTSTAMEAVREDLKLSIKFRNISNNPDPEYKYDDDSGFDLRANLPDGPMFVNSNGGRQLVPTGLYFELPESQELQVRPRSGLAIKHGVTVLNTPGTVDCFTENMVIRTLDGDKTIKDISIGETILSYNIKSNKMEKDVITKIIDTGEQEVVRITTSTGFIEVTNNTEILTNSGWKLACNILTTDKIMVD